MSFTHLHVYSSYSLYKSTILIDELVKKAKQLNFSSVALTDENVLYGVIPFYKACRANGIKPIIGMTMTLNIDGNLINVILLAKTNEGYHHLLQISTHIQTADDPLTIDHLAHLGNGLIVIVKTSSQPINKQLIGENYEFLLELFHRLITIFHKEDIYFSIENDYDLKLNVSYEALRSFIYSNDHIKPVAIENVRYLNEKDVYSYDCLQAMRKGSVWDLKEPSEKVKHKYFCSKEELYDRFSFYDDAIYNTVEIAKKCDVMIDLNTNRLPAYPLKEGETADDVLRATCFNRLHYFYANVTDEIKARLTYELEIIQSLGFSDYFLIVADFVQFAKKNDILVGPGRGSAASSLVAYVLGITMVDPIKHNLLFERFLNPERVSMPDIDIDFSDSRRDEVIQYVKNKYGKKHVAQIVTFGTFGARSLLRDLMKTLQVDERDQSYLLRHIPVQSTKSIIDHVKEQASLREYIKASRKLRLLLHVAKTLEGLPKHVSTHAAGIVITKERLVDYVPLMEGRDNVYQTQFSMNELEAVGLLKIDLLGLKNLSLIERIVKKVQTIENRKFDLTNIPNDDKKTFRFLQAGRTNGIFQLESDGMKRVLKQLCPTTFEDIVALNALYRPGPMEQIPTYIARKHNKESFSYLHPDLKPILEETYGVLIYQEQIMQIAHKIAGFSLGKADLLRRAMSKKEPELMKEQKEAFIKGCMENGYEHKIAEQLFSWIERFADYGFNKSHSVAYSKIAYQLSYLKAHYTHIFFAELLNTTTNEEKLAVYIQEAKQMKIDILPPSINDSFDQFTIEDGKIRIGFLAIKGISYDIVREIIRIRQSGKFTSLFNFCFRIPHSRIKRKTIETLILAGAFDSLHGNRASLLASLDEALERAEFFGNQDGQTNLFAKQLEMREPEYAKVPDFSHLDKLAKEKELLGIYISPHPLLRIRKVLKRTHYRTIHEVHGMNKNLQVKVVSFIQEVRRIRTKRGESMAFILMTDETGEIDTVVFPNVFRYVNDWIDENLLVEGNFRVGIRDGKKQLIANELKIFNNKRLQVSPSYRYRLFLRFSKQMTEFERKQLKELVKKYPGITPIIIYFEFKKQTYKLSKRYSIQINDEVLMKLKQIFGKSNVVLQTNDE